ncbi:hypothetical protein LguiB_019474 [Lonicera macranthoides]
MDLFSIFLPTLSFADPAYAEIFVLHHGETSGNSDYIMQGQLDAELNNIGRQQAAVDRSRNPRERVVVVAHGGVITELHKRAGGRSAGKVMNSSVNVFHLYDGNEWCIKSWGDVSHLNELISGFGGDTTSG